MSEISYLQFLENKKHTPENYGFEPNYIPEIAFDFQKHIIEKAVRKGRMAIFADTGLGKTLMQLAIANNIIKETNKRVLILTPIAVAFQFLLEAEKLGIDDIEYSKNGNMTKKIVICNYERLHYFNRNDFICVICDESSILKNYDGATRNAVNTFMKKLPYRFLSTATPSPNDYIELGTSSEVLGYLGYMEMLSRFFANNENNIRPHEIACKWYLKPHAEKDFFAWVRGWSLSIKMPSDLGFSDEGYILPTLIQNYHKVYNPYNMVENGITLMFNKIAKTMTEVKTEQKLTIKERCETAVEIAEQHETSVYWCNFNDEGDLLAKLDSNAVQLKGGMDIDKKEDILLNFSKGNIKKLITKPKITAFGLNWQHCNHTVFFPSWSYEQYYQSIRRFWRFGQKNEVIADIVISDGQKRVIDALEMKIEKAKQLYVKLNKEVNEKVILSKEHFNQKLDLPDFLRA